jgi:hypothetical protein
MWNARLPQDPPTLASRCYRLTAIGRACIDVVEQEHQTVGAFSRHLHDVLVLCGSGIWFEQLRQFIPPRSLDAALRSLLKLGLVEVVHPAPDAARTPRADRPGRVAPRSSCAHQSLAQLPV